MNERLRGLYLITELPGLRPESAWLSIIDAALANGVSALQFRDKSMDSLRRLRLAALLRSACRAHGVPLIINDDIELAVSVSADGVHLGRDDASVAQARDRLGSESLIGVSCYDSLDWARAAQVAGASYVAFGRFYPSGSKPGASPAHANILHSAQQTLSIAQVAIGGITPENARPLIEAGADVVAVIGAVFDSPDPAETARQFAALFVH